MGYNTDFKGYINIFPHVDPELRYFINNLSRTRRMKRDSGKLQEIFKGEYGYNGQYGDEGEFFIGGTGYAGQEYDESVIDNTEPPKTQPSLWLKWMISEDGTKIRWNGIEKFYQADDWMKYLINNFLIPNGHICNGLILAQGEDPEDKWAILVENNHITIINSSQMRDILKFYTSNEPSIEFINDMRRRGCKSD